MDYIKGPIKDIYTTFTRRLKESTLRKPFVIGHYSFETSTVEYHIALGYRANIPGMQPLHPITLQRCLPRADGPHHESR